MNLRFYPDEILYEKSEPVEEFDTELARTLEDMITAMHLGRGIGLAGVQVGIKKRFFVTHAQDDQPRVFVNPEIIGTSIEESDYEEGCLSIPGMYADVRRPAAVQVQAFDARGKAFRLEADGILARIIQHEYDHLNGVLFIDHLSERRRERLVSVYMKRRPKSASAAEAGSRTASAQAGD